MKTFFNNLLARIENSRLKPLNTNPWSETKVFIKKDDTTPRLTVTLDLASGPITQITCNPAVTQRPDGGYIMIIRGDKPDVEFANGKWPDQGELIRSQAIALSSTPEGPWEIQPKPAVGNLNSEDPAIWYDVKRKRYYGIYHAFGYMGMITSLDGINWEKAKHYKVLDKAIKKADGMQYFNIIHM